MDDENDGEEKTTRKVVRKISKDITINLRDELSPFVTMFQTGATWIGGVVVLPDVFSS